MCSSDLITYVVEDLAPYRRRPDIPLYFGDIMILQNPDDMGDNTAATRYAYLMQFMDGHRLDLTFRPLSFLGPILSDSLSAVLLDKDQRFKLPPPSLRSYFPTRPTTKQFAECCNEFWWLNPYVAKGLFRDQIPYAKMILDELMRRQLMQMLMWYVGLTTDCRVTIGLAGKHLKTYLRAELWNHLERTYSEIGRASCRERV